ncbi:MAG: glycyl radical enzyme [Chloroflexi bacterium GWB2_49_20]|nr:MAG: glycyl radical enzyme [Chloroflexi bacterium GWB2_49_20]OGN78802.1 MAG: glycyl radical enzyme [Chloroflexi bacterium GWC2_49_37]OGN85893.1 MAG: glycyl radical enzyme [Chloroflexi bacterium GWD2_49_16]
MSDRVRKLRQQSLDARETLSSERAELLTEFYAQASNLVSTPVQRARSFATLMEHKSIYIGTGELIVGEKGSAPKVAPTYPELCCHSLEDLDILDSREKTSFKVDAHTRQAYADTVIPFWQGRSLRELLFLEMTDEWKAAYEAGIFTEFMEQRAPGHTVLDGKIYHTGMLDFIARIDKSLEGLDFLNDPQAYSKQEELKAMRITAQALIRFGERHAEEARCQAHTENDPIRRLELEKIAEICTHVPANAPRDFWEALQYYWFVHLGVTTELNTWDSFCPGHLDRHLEPFFQKGLETSEVSADFRSLAEELLHCFWIKFNNQPAPPKVGVTAAESGTYTDFAQINIGGLLADGSDGISDVSYLLLDVIEDMRLLQPSSSIQVSKKNPDRFVKRAAKIIRTGFGQPSIFNADMVVQEMVRVGKSLPDARDGGTSGCVETGAFGKEAYILTGYFNIPKILELALHNGLDPRTGQQLGPQSGDPAHFAAFEDLYTAFEQQMRTFIDIKIKGNNLIEQLYATYMPAPFLSLLVDDCILKGKDYHSGGPRYDSSYIQGVGMGTITDCLSAIKEHVFEKNDLSMPQMLTMLEADFEGFERQRQLLLNKTPRYGNDDPRADDLLVRVFETYYGLIEGRPNTRGGRYHINLLPTTCHIYFGSVTGATPDGRQAWTPLSEGISPVQGADRHGPTAVLKSAARMDHVRTGGTLLNQKFTPQLLKDEDGLNKLVQLVRSYFKLDGHHIQFNVVDAETLRLAQKNPARYRDLIVRVAGYSDYFCDLSLALQEEIIARTEHQEF